VNTHTCSHCGDTPDYSRPCPAQSGRPCVAPRLTRPTRATFYVATRDGRAATRERKGYVMGNYATHKLPGDHDWTFTHLPTGLALSTGECAWLVSLQASLAYGEGCGECNLGVPDAHQPGMITSRPVNR
jgi:hypothetical protein